jgi:2-keto-4-pentenoate hydratase/2-oxohepta-3-ene-1,7-dioic acid hydratase in catechol pathway
MRWLTYRSGSGAEDRVGLLVGDEVHGLEPDVELLDLLGDDGTRLAEAGERARRHPSEVRSLAEVRVRPPIPRPPAIRDFSAFEQHCRSGLEALGLELGDSWFEIPVFYFSSPTAVMTTGDPVAVPPGCERLDFELEIAAIIGRPGGDIDPDEAESHIAGYCIFNDWSARDLQGYEMRTTPIGPAKGKDFANGFGPYLVTPDEIESKRKGRAFDLRMQAWVNGRQYSDGSWSDIYWSCADMIAYASRGTTLVPGDVIGVGTVGSGCILEQSTRYGSERYPWLVPGDEVRLSVEGLGEMVNRITPGAAPKPLKGARSFS